MDAVVTELNGKTVKINGKDVERQEEGRKLRGSKYQIRPTYSVLNLIAP